MDTEHLFASSDVSLGAALSLHLKGIQEVKVNLIKQLNKCSD